MRLTSHLAVLVLAGAALALPLKAFAADDNCPPGGVVHYGVIPYDSSAGFVPLYKHIGDVIAAKLGCKVEVDIGTSYTATIEAMRAHKIDAAEFGPLSYVLAHQVAGAEAVATYAKEDGVTPDTYTASIVTWPGSGIKALKDVAGKSFAYSDPASTSGHLFPAYALAKAGIDPDKGVRGIMAGSHTASFEAIRNHKVMAGEMNSPEISSAKAAGIYNAADYVTLWTSDPIPQDPITVRADLEPKFKARLTKVLQELDLQLTKDQKAIIGISGDRLIPIDDHAFDGIRDLVSVLKIDLSKLGS